MTRQGHGHHEQVLLNLTNVPGNLNKFLFLLNIYHPLTTNQHFPIIQNPYIPILHPSNNQQLLKYNFLDLYPRFSSFFLPLLYRHVF
ncbi:TerD family protein, partial [Bacillus altitudinis]|uniref:TerD family protein n=1 Tax=Bacillus altitudinis TaxID=293387 RepID=UPI001F2E9B9F